VALFTFKLNHLLATKHHQKPHVFIYGERQLSGN
jgi:hypothetical protein